MRKVTQERSKFKDFFLTFTVKWITSRSLLQLTIRSIFILLAANPVHFPLSNDVIFLSFFSLYMEQIKINTLNRLQRNVALIYILMAVEISRERCHAQSFLRLSGMKAISNDIVFLFNRFLMLLHSQFEWLWERERCWVKRSLCVLRPSGGF